LKNKGHGVLKETTFIIGGCKSGKSRHALFLAERVQTLEKIFIATGVAFDVEMKDRISRHRQERNRDWKTVEAPVKLAEAIARNSGNGHLLVVDCLTLWINNLLVENLSPKNISDHADKLVQVLQSLDGPVIVVSNDVGGGIVPENPLARQFRDLAGSTNQKIAACADHVIWMVAGIPVNVKGR
jgi:adenosylcobinamide kinase / adenosylcobinamide-phosphate guanylyltransferase